MPWKSKKQAAFGNSPAGKKKMGEKKVEEFNEKTGWSDLPVWKKPKKKKGKAKE